ncbi:MAG: helix-turn-helix transcriptional regulator [Treponema sp.]|jgi:DNA-binding CsgD family transcriptional regulator|nr:helix-turn-helix transcriptional regulator [Treponema sp.]
MKKEGLTALYTMCIIWYYFMTMFKKFSGVLPLLFLASGLFAQAPAASRTDGEIVYYYGTLYEAVSAAADIAAAGGGSFAYPDEITVLSDLVLDEPLTVADGVHIRLTAGGSDRTIRRGGGNIEFPVVWVNGDGASLTLGKPDMGHELIFDGGYTAGDPASIKAHAPLAAVSGPGAKLIMHGGVTLQNNYNNGDGPSHSHYRNGAGVFIRTEENIEERQAEFVMKGGVIRGNVNDLQHTIACGGGVFIAGFGIFTMEGGAIMDNSAVYGGGGFHVGSRGSFKKTGGVIYGGNAALGLRNVSLEGTIVPKTFPITKGHAVCVAVGKPVFFFRNDTVSENDFLSYAGAATGNGVIGDREKWDNSDKALRRLVLICFLSAVAVGIAVFFIVTKIVVKKRLEKIKQIAAAAKVDLDCYNFTDSEKEVCRKLLTKHSTKQIAYIFEITESGVNYHIKNIYRKLDIQSRPEFFTKLLNLDKPASN